MEPRLHSLKPGLGWELRFMTCYKVLHPRMMLCSTPGEEGHEETETGLRSWAHQPVSEQGRIQSLTVPGARPPVLTVIISLCGSNNKFISHCASPWREFAQLMYISGLYKDILDSHEFWAVTLDGNYWQLRHRESKSFGFKYVLIKKSLSLICSAGFYGNSPSCPNLQHILYISACVQHAAFCRAWNFRPICIRQGPEIKILVPTVLSFEEAQPTLELTVLVALQELS